MKYLVFFAFAFAPFACTLPGSAQPDSSSVVNAEAPASRLMAEPDTAVVQPTAPAVAADTAHNAAPEPPALEFSTEYLMGKFDPAQHPDFTTVDKKYADEEGYFLRKDTYASFQKMWEAAKADGISLSIVSATRNFERQKSIWEAKWTGSRKIENGTNAAQKYPDAKTRALKILEYSSMPGSSRHHWGTDIDLNDLDNYTFEQGPGKKVYAWLKKHAHEYGFCQPYTAKSKERSTGYNEEKWHWSYIPVAQKLTDLAAQRLNDTMISGFKGAETANSIGIVEKYVLGVNKNCL